MSISIDQSLEVFRDSFHSFYIIGIQKCKDQRFLWKNIFGCIFIISKCMCLRTGPGDLKTPNIWNLRYCIFFYAFLKKNVKKNHIFIEIWKSSVAHVKIGVCIFFYLNLVGKKQQNSIRLFCGGKSLTTIQHFRFHCEILTINLTAICQRCLLF